MPMPRRALSSIDMCVISSPLNRMRPPSMVYLGIPAMTFKRVVLPVPLGPNRAWVSPRFILRLKFFKTCLLPMLTDRSSISSSYITSNQLINLLMGYNIFCSNQGQCKCCSTAMQPADRIANPFWASAHASRILPSQSPVEVLLQGPDVLARSLSNCKVATNSVGVVNKDPNMENGDWKSSLADWL
jgi:hypothetical protein